MGIISSLLLIQNDSGRGHIFARIHGRMNILLEDFRLNYEPARIFARAEALFGRLTECETAPKLFLDEEIERIARARSANYACMVMLMLMEIIRTESMPAFCCPDPATGHICVANSVFSTKRTSLQDGMN